MKGGSVSLGVFDHLAGALAFLAALSLGPRIIGALLSLISSVLKPGSFVVIGPVSWQGGGPYWGLLFVVALVGGTAVALDRLSSKSNHRVLGPPVLVAIS